MSRNTGDGYFIITRIHRSDLEDLGFDTSAITDEQMERLARQMEADYVEQLFWTSTAILAEGLHFQKRTAEEGNG